MDMNRKKRLGLKNKKMQMASSLMKTIVLVLSACFMMVATAHSGAFLRESPKYSNFTSITLLNETQVEVIDRSRVQDPNDSASPFDTWHDYNTIDSSDYGYYTGTDYYGYGSSDYVYYLGTFDDNYGDEEKLLPLIQYFLDDYDSSLQNLGYEKMEFDDDIGTTRNFTGTNLIVEVTSTKNEDGKVEALGGTWEFEKDGSAETIDFYVVKGGSEYALYYVDPAQSSGTWTTAHLINNGGNQAGLSYISVMKTTITDDDNPPNDPGAVPEPATMLLFGFSLMGLAGMARRKNSKF